MHGKRGGQFFTTFVSATFVVRCVVSVALWRAANGLTKRSMCMPTATRALHVLEICAIEDVRRVEQTCFRTLRAKHFVGRHLRFKFSVVTRRSFLGFFHSSVMSETKAPSAEELAAVKLKNAQTKEGGAFDEAPYKAVWESSGGDGAKAAETIGLLGVPASYDEYTALVKSGMFKD